jgi:putative CocE/NonD family hydrolase
MRQPYGCRIASSLVYAHPSWYAAQGYLVVVVDVRGRGDSEGHFSGFGQEANDGDDCLAWLRSDKRCNGRVGSYGFSYQGLTQLLGNDPALAPDAIAPAMAGLNERLHWACEGGAHRWVQCLSWGLQLAAETRRRANDEQGWQQIRRSLSSHPPSDGLALLRRYDPSNPVLAWLEQDPQHGDGWNSHPPAPGRLERPLLLVEGWSDPHLRGGIDLWQRSRAAAANPLLRIGPWSHLAWDRRVGQLDCGAAACGRVDSWQLSFFDRHLRDRINQPAEPGCLAYDPLGQLWQQRDPGSSSGQRWGLASAGLAACRSDGGELLSDAPGRGSVSWVHDPWRPVPGRGGHLGLDAGPVDRANLDARGDVVCFSSAPLPQALELWGEPVLQLQLAADQPGFDLCAALAVIRHQGSQVLQLSTGVLRQLGEHCLRLEWRQVRLQPLLCSLQAGDQLRLSLAAAAWPQITVNPGSGEGASRELSSSHRVVTLEIDLSDSYLQLLPVATEAN